MPPQDKLTILFLAANPADTVKLQLDEEMRAVDSALRMANYRERFDLRTAWAVRPRDLQELLLRYHPVIVHFSAHGSAEGEILLQTDDGNSTPLATSALAALFAILQDNVRCVVLNACFTAPQALAIAAHIDCVVGMSRAILDEAAIDFARAFYQALGYGRSVQTAFDLGCHQIGRAGEGRVYRDVKLIGAPTTTPTDNTPIPQLIALRLDPAEIVLVHAPPEVAPARIPRLSRRRWLAVGSAVAIVGVLLAAFLLWPHIARAPGLLDAAQTPYSLQYRAAEIDVSCLQAQLADVVVQKELVYNRRDQQLGFEVAGNPATNPAAIGPLRVTLARDAEVMAVLTLEIAPNWADVDAHQLRILTFLDRACQPVAYGNLSRNGDQTLHNYETIGFRLADEPLTLGFNVGDFAAGEQHVRFEFCAVPDRDCLPIATR